MQVFPLPRQYTATLQCDLLDEACRREHANEPTPRRRRFQRLRRPSA